MLAMSLNFYNNKTLFPHAQIKNGSFDKYIRHCIHKRLNVKRATICLDYSVLLCPRGKVGKHNKPGHLDRGL